MKRAKIYTFLIVAGLLSALLLPLLQVHAAPLAGENFTGISTPANSWTSGGAACLTAATSSAANSIPACSGGPLDTVGNGLLRLTPATNSSSGFAFYNTPVSAADGLNIEFNMHQYGGTGADGISFFLIDGSESPSQPGALGGALGYASSGATPGLEGGYIGVGFDRFGNFSNSNVGGGGPGPQANSIGVRGSEATGYDFITMTAANGNLSGTTRTNSLRKVKINVSTGNIMSVFVDYNDGSGYQSELSGIDLNTINGPGSLPPTFKFGFAASTGGSTNNHAISGLTVETNPPSVGINLSHTGNIVQGGTAAFTLAVSNQASAEATAGTITVEHTLPAGITPTSASGTGWTCEIDSQVVTCTRPGSGGDALNPGSSTPNITVNATVASNATGSLNSTATVDTADNDSTTASDIDNITVLTGSYLDSDGIFNVIEDDAPNDGDGNDDGTADSEQDSVTSFFNTITNSYVTLETTGCSGTNNAVSINPESSNTVADGVYSYPLGLMDFSITCASPGDTATITQYYYGNYDPSHMVMRKYNSVTNTYSTIQNATITNVSIGNQAALKVVYDVTDGGELDEDGLINGTIVDPAGIAVLSTNTTVSSTSSQVGSPNTGLHNKSMLLYYALGTTGLLLCLYAIISRRRSQPKST